VNEQLAQNADPFTKRMVSRTLAGADFLVVDAPEMAARCRALAGVKVPTRVVHLGVDTKRFRPGYKEEANRWRESLKINDGTIVLFSMRALSELYNHHLILEAFALALPCQACLRS
jgi:glycosyltransferase involved in cell wall biosynthesis